ncbi:hypothetical protein M885DRAFT_532173 [Pelagophyceae sp. CCMP2097]|nr:hypothetical protein M885DRAFT_532173 [Pelagophyceae sp. CCMP2097]
MRCRRNSSTVTTPETASNGSTAAQAFKRSICVELGKSLREPYSGRGREEGPGAALTEWTPVSASKAKVRRARHTSAPPRRAGPPAAPPRRRRGTSRRRRATRCRACAANGACRPSRGLADAAGEDGPQNLANPEPKRALAPRSIEPGAAAPPRRWPDCLF